MTTTVCRKVNDERPKDEKIVSSGDNLLQSLTIHCAISFPLTLCFFFFFFSRPTKTEGDFFLVQF